VTSVTHDALLPRSRSHQQHSAGVGNATRVSAAVIRFRALLGTPANVASLPNNLNEGSALVSYSLYRYDCSPSLRALPTELTRVDEDAADRLRRELARLVIMFRREGAPRLVRSGELAASGATR
jgi:hypothetical protein